MNYGRTILPIFVLIGALAAVFVLALPENTKAAPIVSLSVSPSSVTSATTPIDFSWSASDPSGWCCYYYYQTYNYSNGALSPWNYLGTVTSSRNTLADFGYTQYGTYDFLINAISWTGVWNYGYSEWKSVSFFPPLPSNVSFSISPSTITLGQSSTFSWSATNANEYWLYSYTVQAWEQLGSSAGSFLKSSAGLPTGMHWFIVNAYNRPNPTWVYSPLQSLTIIQPIPTVPTNFSFNPSSGVQGYTTTASWSASLEVGRYEYYAPSLGVSAWTSIGNVTSIPLNTATFSPNTHTVSLRACNSAGCSGSANATFTVQQPAPVAPSVSISPTTITTLQSATFSWGSASNATACTVFIGTYNGLGNCGGGTQTFPGSSFGIGTHTAYIRACNTSGCVNSNTVTLTVTTAAPTTASISADRTTVQIGGQIMLSFSGDNSPTSYKIYRCDGASCNPIFLIESVQNTMRLDYSDTGAHRYQIQACNAAGCSALSQIVTINILGRTPPFLNVNLNAPRIEVLEPTTNLRFNTGTIFTLLARPVNFTPSGNMFWQLRDANRNPVTSFSALRDDGLSGDGIAGDGVYGTTVDAANLSWGNYQIYIKSLPTDSPNEVTTARAIAINDNCPTSYNAAFVMIYENQNEIQDYTAALVSIKGRLQQEIPVVFGGLRLIFDEDVFIPRDDTIIRTDQYGNLDINDIGFLDSFYAEPSRRNKYDFLIVYTDFSVGGPGVAWSISFKNNVEGIGLTVRQIFAGYPDQRFSNLIFSKDIHRTYTYASPAEARDQSLFHEIGHQWLFFVKGSLQNKILSADGAHPRGALDSYSPWGGGSWTDLFDGTFRSSFFPKKNWREDGIEDVLQYLVGTRPKDAVRESMLVVNYTDETEFQNALLEEGGIVHGQRAELSTDYIIQAHGIRRCVDI